MPLSVSRIANLELVSASAYRSLLLRNSMGNILNRNEFCKREDSVSATGIPESFFPLCGGLRRLNCS
jgi:hypothetical protein